MSIQINAKPESDFNNPLGLLSDCHRRIEKFLAQLRIIASSSVSRGGVLDDGDRAALETALNYFRRAAPLHTQDEEESLFPRMRVAGGARVEAAFAALAALEADHDTADIAHTEIDSLGRRWLANCQLAPDQAEHLAALLANLQSLYARHIAVEDSEVFVLAGEILPPADIRELGREMAVRRGLDPDNLPSISHCQIRKLTERAT